MNCPHCGATKTELVSGQARCAYCKSPLVSYPKPDYFGDFYHHRHQQEVELNRVRPGGVPGRNVSHFIFGLGSAGPGGHVR